MRDFAAFAAGVAAGRDLAIVIAVGFWIGQNT